MNCLGKNLGIVINTEKLTTFNPRIKHNLSTSKKINDTDKIKVLGKKKEVIHNFSKTNNNNKIKYLLLKTQKMVVDK